MNECGIRPETICAIIVTFNPDEHFLERLDRIARQVGEVVIVDNHSTNSDFRSFKEKGFLSSRVDLIQNEQNYGLGKALNQGVQRAIGKGYRWVVTFDQDTVVDDDMTRTLGVIYDRYPNQESVAMIAPNFTNKNLNNLNYCSDEGSFEYLEVDAVITSGCLTSTRVFETIGPFREDFFIDRVDTEYCLRATSFGYKILITKKPLMRHSLGNITTHRLLWRRVRTTNHSAARRYYMVRNEIQSLGCTARRIPN